MTNAVESLAETCKLKGKTVDIPHRKLSRPVPACVIDPNDIPGGVVKLLKAIAEVSRSRACGAMLFIADDMSAYVINEERAIAQIWVVKHWREFVGLYTHTPRRGLKPDPQGMVEDIGCHLADLARSA